MRAMVLLAPGRVLELRELPDPVPGAGQVLVEVLACAVCRTDLHLADGELAAPRLPLVLGHQIVGRVLDGADTHPVGSRVGIGWLGWTCGTCRYCRTGRENLCPRARFTGRDLDGGFAGRAVADARFAFPLPDAGPAAEAAPLLCGGLIGARALRLAGDAERLGLYGFGSAAHMVCQVAVADRRRVFAFTREGDSDGQAFARRLGAEWAGSARASAPEELDAAIIFAPAGELVPVALRAVARGGNVVCAGIHMTDIPSFPYADLWGERTLRSVANLTRADAGEFLSLAPKVPVRTHVSAYRLDEANRALDDLRGGRVQGTAVLDLEGKHPGQGGFA